MQSRSASRAALRGGPLTDRSTSEYKGQSGKSKGFLVASIVLNAVLAVVVLGRSAYNPDEERNREIGLTVKHTEELMQSLHQDVQNISQSLVKTKQALDFRIERDNLQPRESEEGNKYWLTIGITTVPRKKDTDYLTKTLETLFEELPIDKTDPLYGRVKVILMNNRPGKHKVFSAIHQRIREAPATDIFKRKADVYLAMVDNPGLIKDPTPDAPDPDDFNNPTDRPGRQVRQQTCDLVTLLNVATPLSHYYMFMEDDFRVCPYALRALQYAIRKLNSVPGTQRWLALRVSYGMNGVIVPNDMLPSLAGHMQKLTAKWPPDLIWLDWFNGRQPEIAPLVKGRPTAVFRYNLLDHIGAVSSFDVRVNRPAFPGCYEEMDTVWSLHDSERFKKAACPNQDISPCPASKGAAEDWLSQPFPWNFGKHSG